MRIKDVERYSIPIRSENFALVPGLECTTAGDLIEALLRVPREAVISTDYSGSGIFATHYKPDIEVN